MPFNGIIHPGLPSYLLHFPQGSTLRLVFQSNKPNHLHVLTAAFSRQKKACFLSTCMLHTHRHTLGSPSEGRIFIRLSVKSDSSWGSPLPHFLPLHNPPCFLCSRPPIQITYGYPANFWLQETNKRLPSLDRATSNGHVTVTMAKSENAQVEKGQ